MQFNQLIKARKSVRGYQNKPVPREVIEAIIEVAKWAPSSMNTQPWHVHVVTGEPLERIRKGNTDNMVAGIPPKRDFPMKESYEGVHRKRQIDVAVQLFEAMGIERDDKNRRTDWVMRGFRQFDAPVSLVLTYDKYLEPAAISQFDLGAFSHAIVLAAWEQGLGCVINGQGIMQSSVVREHAGIPDDQNIMICIALGYPDESFVANSVKSVRADNATFVRYVGFDEATHTKNRKILMSSELLETFHDGIATLTINRPQSRNSMTTEVMQGLSEAMPRLANDPSVRLVVLTGAGGAFCAGGDVKGFVNKEPGSANSLPFEQNVNLLRASMEVSRWLHEMPKPTLAVISGPAAGAGLSLALACDMRIAADDAKLTTAFSKIGLSGDFGGSYFLNLLVGAAKAREMYFTGEVVLGAQAALIGLVNRSVPKDQLAQAAHAWALELAALPTLAIGYMKRNLNAGLRGSLSEVLDLEAIHMIRTFETEDHKAAAIAFVEKKSPRFQGH